DHVQLLARRAVDTHITRQLGTLELQAAPIGIEFARLVFKTVNLNEQLTRLKARRNQRKRRQHQRHGKKDHQAAHYPRPLPARFPAGFTTKSMAVMKEAP